MSTTEQIDAPNLQARELKFAGGAIELGSLVRSRLVLGFIGIVLTLLAWYLFVEVLKLPRFRELPGLVAVVREWTSRDPVYGISIFTAEYYTHIAVSLRRVGIAFVLSTAIGVPLGLFLGWSERFCQHVFPVFETLRPIPPLAWVPLAILMFKGSETPGHLPDFPGLVLRHGA